MPDRVGLSCAVQHRPCAGRADYVRALPGDQGAALMRPGVRAEDMPLCRYRDALLLKTKLRKAGKCTLCWEPMKVGDPAWRVIQDNMTRGVVRSQRFHRDHFSGGGHYDD